jgi:membrane carboxypeptidase/penicillin-binding protein
MAALDSMILSLEEDIKNANTVKDLVIQRLLDDKVITNQQAEDYADKWQVIIIKPAWFERWMEKLKIKTPNSYRFKYVKFED